MHVSDPVLIWNFPKAAELEIEAYPLLDELTSKISTLNLERVRRLKSRLVALTRRVQKVLVNAFCFCSHMLENLS